MHVNFACGMIKINRSIDPDNFQPCGNLAEKKIDKLDVKICEVYSFQSFEEKFFHKLHIYNYCSFKD